MAPFSWGPFQEGLHSPHQRVKYALHGYWVILLKFEKDTDRVGGNQPHSSCALNQANIEEHVDHGEDDQGII